MTEQETDDIVFVDRVVRCCDCGCSFVFSSGEAAYYWSKSLSSPPKRCKPCRELRKTTIVPGREVHDGD